VTHVSRPFGDVTLLGDADVAALLPMADAIEALEQTFREEARGQARSMPRTRVAWEDGRMQALGGHLPDRRCAGVKQWAVTPRGAQPTIVLFSTESGRVVAILEAAELGRIRTGATSGVAIRHMARQDASTLLVIGTGRQAMTQVAAAVSVRDVSQVLVAARDRARAAAFATRVEEQLAVPARAVASVAEGAAEADVITAITNATEPVLLRDMVGPASHVNAVGAIVPHAVEVDPALLAAADLLAADAVEQALAESAEVRAAVERHGASADAVVPLHRLVSGEVRAPAGLTVFKSLGLGLSDVTLAELSWRRAVAR